MQEEVEKHSAIAGKLRTSTASEYVLLEEIALKGKGHKVWRARHVPSSELVQVDILTIDRSKEGDTLDALAVRYGASR